LMLKVLSRTELSCRMERSLRARNQPRWRKLGVTSSGWKVLRLT